MYFYYISEFLVLHTLIFLLTVVNYVFQHLETASACLVRFKNVLLLLLPHHHKLNPLLYNQPISSLSQVYETIISKREEAVATSTDRVSV